MASVDWSATCEQLLRKVLNKFRNSRIKMGWLEDNFKAIKASTSILIELEDIRLDLDQQIKEEELDDLYKIDFRGRLKEDWLIFHNKHIKMWQCRYDYLPTREPFLTPELATSLDYMD
ncbi:hypothetical protein Goshw_012063 [Gossypium schwendimanii]|uniref:Uncharacterized protein n=1 Tax=Gossypium schwendimanii TaxID=34291 RepID=A0A7J9L9D8_GOSSC|nr:hypothetical protein [Gossypium schwendimanii]